MILVAVAEKQADALRAEITALKESSAQARAAMDALREVADNLSKERDLARSNFDAEAREMAEAHARECAELRAQVETLQGSTATKREALKIGREALIVDRAAFEADKASAQRALHDDRKSIAQNLHRMIQIIQPNPFSVGAGPASLIGANKTAGSCTPEARIIDPSDMSIPMRRSADQETAPANELLEMKQLPPPRLNPFQIYLGTNLVCPFLGAVLSKYL
ncbi:hypothetical protein C8R44DRAFT_876798 [Mycena epipterygia]|nr:hypothetical protein C8R44DRAFT_876798 [Mycena epipterygia]